MMDTRQYHTIQLQLEREKNELLQEIGTLILRRKRAEQKFDYEVEVFCSRNKPIIEGSSALAGILIGDSFSAERMNKLEKEIKKLTEFIQTNEKMLERLKEKESTINSLYGESIVWKQKEKEKKEEKQLLDMKIMLRI